MSTILPRLLQLSDPTLPVGGYAHSAGLETYIQQGIVHNRVKANEFVTEMLTRNLRYTDAAFASLAYEAAAVKDFETILKLDAEFTAVKLPMQIRQASQKLGMRLIKIFQSIHKNKITDQYKYSIEKKGATGHYCSGQPAYINWARSLFTFYCVVQIKGCPLTKTIGWTIVCGSGHVLSSVILGLGAAALGWSFSKLNLLENVRGGIAGWVMLLSGFC